MIYIKNLRLGKKSTDKATIKQIEKLFMYSWGCNQRLVTSIVNHFM